MLVGILSDSHGDAAATARAISLLEHHGAKKLFHCGDICGTAVLDEFVGHDCLFVWGNCDQQDASMKRYVADLGLSWPKLPLRVELAGKRIAVYHGHERSFSTALQQDDLDYLFFGHTHLMSDIYANGCRQINPGALHRASVHTVAILDLETDELSFLCIETGERVAIAEKI